MHSNSDDHSQLPAELQAVAARLTSESAEDAESLRRVRARVRRPARRQAPSFLRTRLAMVAMLTAGLAMSVSGTTLAVIGTSGTDNASIAQYSTGTSTGGNSGNLGGNNGNGNAGHNGNSNRNAGQNVNGTSGAQAENQAGEATIGGNELPFTGFAVIPLIVIGFGLIGAGMLLGRAARPSRDGETG